MNSTIIISTIGLVLVVVVLLFRVQSLISIVRGSDEKKGGTLNKFNAAMFLVFMVLGLGAFFWYSFGNSDEFLLPDAVSEHGQATDSLMWVTFWVIGFVFVLTTILLFVFAFKYQYKEGNKATFFPESSLLEMVWTIIPAIVLTYLVFGGWKEWTKITTAPNAAEIEQMQPVELEIVGQQWEWNVRYAGADGVLGKHYYRRIDADNLFGLKVEDAAGLDDFYDGPRQEKTMYLPVNRMVHMKIRAKDVLHSVFLPHFRVKMDAVPGNPTEFWFKPTKTTAEMRNELAKDPKYQEGETWRDWNYELACTEICGKAHYNMRYEVVVLSQEDYNAWYASQIAWSVKRKDYIKEKLEEINPDIVSDYMKTIDDLAGDEVAAADDADVVELVAEPDEELIPEEELVDSTEE